MFESMRIEFFKESWKAKIGQVNPQDKDYPDAKQSDIAFKRIRYHAALPCL